ncbi:peptidoglycan editing factor PgeF [Nitrosophilus kaiyonis]|uniref:peptidoglycan editing factor PgeF n=1 Tax=Nitrosophilus kaiyonis TaxID=2930200 RepID=UPI002492D461|nr:peptidoglycan editing factor PgeF [Nitrosophilus kaiyonis]
MINYIFTDRFGGVSEENYKSFNLAFHVGDKRENVEKNREILKNKIKVSKIVFMNQLHSDKVEVVNDLDKIYNCDGIICDKKDVALAVMVADCIPLLLYSDSLIAAVHAGRNGTFLEISKKCVLKMKKMGAKNIKAIIGPSIRSCCYEVGEEILDIAKKSFSEKYIKNKKFLDIVSMNIDQLKSVGVENIKLFNDCTCCNKKYFSYRREKITGRFVGVIWRK